MWCAVTMLSEGNFCVRLVLTILACLPAFRCYNECREGKCSGSPLFECECSLGWTSDPATLVLSGVECDVDCGCNFHSTCITAPGICDQCQGEYLLSSVLGRGMACVYINVPSLIICMYLCIYYFTRLDYRTAL